MPPAPAPAPAAGPVRVALLGVDGSGKSTCARLLAQRSSADRPHVVLSCLRPHENPGGPLHELSRHLDTLSSAADHLGSPDLKLAVLYLQMCTYGVAERFFTGRPAAAIITERHPLIDTLVYLPLYRNAITTTITPNPQTPTPNGTPAQHDQPPTPNGTPAQHDRFPIPDRAGTLREQLTRLPTPAVQAALGWCRTLAPRHRGRVPRLDTLATELIALLDLPSAALMTELTTRYAVSPPDVAILLDLDPAEAARRVQARDRRPEPHERADLLPLIRDGYDEALKAFTSTRVHRIVVGHRPAHEVAAEIARTAGL
ncbi:hypothetical protein AB0C28_43625 [Nonomuraea sp. NPDC048892]|uniref:hypothetical protein n=1 Tax=Nonomuraea sp. NPDC048892 TaxID=3154624 RepID=UPI0033F74B47